MSGAVEIDPKRVKMIRRMWAANRENKATIALLVKARRERIALEAIAEQEAAARDAAESGDAR